MMSFSSSPPSNRFSMAVPTGLQISMKVTKCGSQLVTIQNGKTRLGPTDISSFGFLPI